MSVDIEPFELSFRRPFTVEVSQILTIKNPNSSPIAFKVKTTAPKQYTVRPNAGRIEPGQDFNVTVVLQPMKQEPPLDARCRDKFLVQSATITPDKEFASIGSVLDSTEKGQLQERKIRVNWLPTNPQDDAAANSISGPAAVTPSKSNVTNGAHDTPDAGRSYASPSANGSSTPSSAPPPYRDDVADHDEVSDAPDTHKSAIAVAATNVSSAAQMTYEEIKAKLVQAEAQVAALKDSGMRQRNVKAATEAVKKPAGDMAQAVRQGTEGVSVKVVALLCLLSFLLAYFFF